MSALSNVTKDEQVDDAFIFYDLVPIKKCAE